MAKSYTPGESGPFLTHSDIAVCLFRRLLDKQERVDAIIASLAGEDAEEQLEEIQQLVTPSERMQLNKVAEASKT